MKYPQVVSMPSAVSDWLEEQLEARGIDSVVYTRYILSLLHRDSTDLICPDQDSCFTHSCKEVRRSGASRKRLRRTSDWWAYDQADVDQLKRTAAVECLMSASDQKCGIESLVDELCEKLKEINNDSNANTETACTITNNTYNSKTSPQELADQYYAAFPPLNRNKSATNSPGVVTLIPKWIASPKKKQLRKHNRSASYDDKFHCKVGKSRLNNNINNNKSMGWFPKKIEAANGWVFGGFDTTKTKRRPKNMMSDFARTTKPNSEVNEFEHLLGKGLLDSPVPPQEDQVVALMNMANMRDTGRNTIISCGTNITNSIWTHSPKKTPQIANRPLPLFENDHFWDDFEWNGWPSSDDTNMSAENETNISLPRFAWNPYASGKWSNAEAQDEKFLAAQNMLAESFTKLNHRKESSAFSEVLSRAPGYGRFGKNTASAANIFKQDAATRKADADKDSKEDLLTSDRTHFKPINEKAEARGPQYPDGTTFVIPSTLDKVNYKRSESGTMFLESEFGVTKKYQEYKNEGLCKSGEFAVKFNINENSKGCQTDFEDTDYNDEVASVFAKKDYRNNDSFFTKPFSPGFVTDVSDKIWKSDSYFTNTNNDSPNSDMKRCTKCNNDTIAWQGFLCLDINAANGYGWNPWKNNGLCWACLDNVPRRQNQQQRTELKEEISRESEELFSVLSKVYLGQLSNAEISCDKSEVIEPKDGKRRMSNSFEVGSRGDSWSFASRLKENCFIQMSTLPTLRSVTL